MSEEKKILSEDFLEVFQDTVADIPQSQEMVLSEGEQKLEIARREQILREKDDQIHRLNEVHGLRKKFLMALFIYFCVWSGLTFLILILVGCPARIFTLSDAVLCALLGTTFAQVVGLTAVAFKWLFPKKD